MATQLENNLIDIINELETKLTPQNIKSGVQIFNVTGQAEGGNTTNIEQLITESTTGEVLWQNPDTTQTFAPQTITLSSDDYDYLLWLFKQRTDANFNFAPVISAKGFGVLPDALQTYIVDNAGYLYALSRVINYIDDTSFTVEECSLVDYNKSESRIDNKWLIPYKVIGFKLLASAEDYSLEEKLIGKWIDGKPLYKKVVEFSNATISPGETEYDLGVDNVEQVVNIECIFNYNNIVFTHWIYIRSISYSPSTDKIVLNLDTNITAIPASKLYFIVKYTKSN